MCLDEVVDAMDGVCFDRVVVVAGLGQQVADCLAVLCDNLLASVHLPQGRCEADGTGLEAGDGFVLLPGRLSNFLFFLFEIRLGLLDPRHAGGLFPILLLLLWLLVPHVRVCECE